MKEFLRELYEKELRDERYEKRITSLMIPDQVLEYIRRKYGRIGHFIRLAVYEKLLREVEK